MNPAAEGPITAAKPHAKVRIPYNTSDEIAMNPYSYLPKAVLSCCIPIRSTISGVLTVGPELMKTPNNTLSITKDM